MAASYTLPPPSPLDIHGPQAAEKWKKFELAWNNYALATELDKKSEAVQVATLLTVIGEEARDVFSTFTGWEDEGDKAKIKAVLAKFAQYCQPRKNIPFERYRFNRRMQEPGESYDQYRTALRKLAESCDFQTVTPEELLRDRLVFGIKDAKARERLLRESNLTLAKTDDICHAAESMLTQLKVVDESLEAAVNAVKPKDGAKDKATASEKRMRECWNCGRKHEFHKKELCPAYGKACNKCNKMNHFAAKCRSPKSVQTVDEEVFQTQSVEHDESQFVTLKVESGNYIRFQVDTGAQCNVLPVETYKKATKDAQLSQVSPGKSQITAYGGTQLPVKGTVILQVWRGEYKGRLECKLVDSPNIRPLLGRKACLGMKIIEYLDNDHLNKPSTSGASVFALNDPTPVSKQQIIERYPKVFSEGVGLLEGHYHIRLDKQAEPVQHASRRVPVALRDRLKDTLDDLTKQNIIAPVTKPTPWISSMVVVPKKDETLRICLDPKDLNKAIQRENYPLPTIEEIATRLHGAKLFSILDVRNGFWHVALDEPSSFLTTFHTPFGRFRWRRMPFGICSAPEVFQRRMHELIEGLHGMEVVADDFAAVGFGETLEEATLDHDKNLKAFLERCEEKNIKLNAEKLKLRMREVPFIGHIATAEGLCVDPAKVGAIRDMPQPENVAAVQRLLGLAQYLSKFLPHLADITKPLRELTQEDTEWIWDQPQKEAFETLKKAVSSTPVLRYYNLKEDVTLQCDASPTGLGAALMQNGQPVAYASRALTSAESRYAQIEKELLAIVYACDHFEPHIYGRETVQVETDHQPLQAIVVKPLNSAPKRLQRMLLRLQKYNLKVKYKRGKEMFLADTLSRAHLSEVSTCEYSADWEEIDQTSTLAVTEEQLKALQQASGEDHVLAQLRDTVQQGWPNNKSEVPETLHAYYDFRDELTHQGPLVFKGERLVIPAKMRKEMMEVTHATHIGREGCIRRARETMFWPRMVTELKEYISKCDICMAYRATPTKEPLLQHEFDGRPWSKIGADLCDLQGRTLLVVTDYYSNFVEVENIQKLNTGGVTKALRVMFSRYGIPDTVMSDNGPQFGSTEFASFAKAWGFTHVTSSPRYPQSNGKAENGVKVVKRLFTKCREAGQSEYLALLDWRNTPTEGIRTSPAQRFLGRRCKTRLPVAASLLTPQYPTKEDSQAILSQKQRQQHYYNRHVKELQPIAPGETIRMRLPGQLMWSSGVCTDRLGPRSYRLNVGERTYVRNRRQLIRTRELIPCDPDMTGGAGETVMERRPEAESSQAQQEPDGDLEQQRPEDWETEQPALPRTPQPRRSQRNRKPPEWITSYVPY